jgi:hypothetical protein
MLYRVIDNYDGRVLAICFSEQVANHILSMYPPDETIPGDPGTIRYVWEDCFQNGARRAEQIGDTIAQLGREIQYGPKGNP